MLSYIYILEQMELMMMLELAKHLECISVEIFPTRWNNKTAHQIFHIPYVWRSQLICKSLQSFRDLRRYIRIIVDRKFQLATQNIT